MACNKYHAHLQVLPEDDPNRQMANGFLLHPALQQTAIQVLPVAGGWRKALAALKDVHTRAIEQYPARRMLLVIDFDDDFAARLQDFRAQVPSALSDRVFLLGTWSEPENLKTSLRKSYEAIGLELANDCAEDKTDLWDHELLQHNRHELQRMIAHVKPFLFN